MRAAGRVEATLRMQLQLRLEMQETRGSSNNPSGLPLRSSYVRGAE